MVSRYVERNARNAYFVKRAEDWRWGSVGVRDTGEATSKLLLSPWPLSRPRTWVRKVSAPQSQKEVEALRSAVNRGTPFGTDAWQKRTARRLSLEYTQRPR